MARALDYSKFIRDEVLGFIGITREENAIIDTREFQRLRRIRQLDVTELVYPGACHNRFVHSLGVMYLATRMAEEILAWRQVETGEQLNQSDEKRIIGELRIAALLHDIGHYALSHCGESALREIDKDAHHEHLAQALLKSPSLSKCVEKALKAVNSTATGAELISHTIDTESYVLQILDSDLDADKMDYLIRDSHHTGVAYGVFDRERLFSMLRYNNGFLTVDRRGVNAVESYVIARYEMYNQVYFHKTVACFSAIARRIIKKLIEYGCLPSYSRLIENISEIINVDDYQFISFVRDAANGNIVDNDGNRIDDEGLEYLAQHMLWRKRIPVAINRDSLVSPLIRPSSNGSGEKLADWISRSDLAFGEIWDAIEKNEFADCFAGICKKSGLPLDAILTDTCKIAIPRVIPRVPTDDEEYDKEIILQAGENAVEGISRPKWLLDLIVGSTLRTVRIFAPTEVHEEVKKEVSEVIKGRIGESIRETIQF